LVLQLARKVSDKANNTLALKCLKGIEK